MTILKPKKAVLLAPSRKFWAPERRPMRKRTILGALTAAQILTLTCPPQLSERQCCGIDIPSVTSIQPGPKAHHRPRYRRLDHERLSKRNDLPCRLLRRAAACSAITPISGSSFTPASPVSTPISARKIRPLFGTLSLSSFSYDVPLSLRASPACISQTLSKIIVAR